jgi:HK97 family phage major capsid protein
MSLISQLVEEREGLDAAVEVIVGRAEQRGADLTEDERGEIKRIQERVAVIDRDLKTLGEAQESRRRFGELTSKLAAPKSPQPAPVEQREALSLGAAFLESPEFRSYRGSGTSSRFEYRAPGDPISTSVLKIAKPRVSGPAESDIDRRFPLFGLVGTEQVSSGAFEYIQIAWTDAAAVVAEGALKPEATMTETLTPGTVDTIAHWVKVTRQALEDGDRLRSVIDGKLSLGVARAQHKQITDAMAAATGVANVDSEDMLGGIRQAVGVVEAAGWTPNAVLLHPTDYAVLDVAALHATTDMSRRSEVWGLRVVPNPTGTAGKAIVGDFTQAVTRFTRTGISVYATDSHADTFVHNIITILAEARSSAIVSDKTAMATVTFTAP